MASKWLEDKTPSAEGPAPAGEPLEPWQDPQYESHFAMLDPFDRRAIRLTALATNQIWDAYKACKKQDRWSHIVVDFAGSVVDSWYNSATAAEEAALGRHAVYNLKSRKCWRPVWYPTTPLNIRGLGNMAYEPVYLYGWESFIEGWENRPRAKLFENL